MEISKEIIFIANMPLSNFFPFIYMLLRLSSFNHNAKGIYWVDGLDLSCFENLGGKLNNINSLISLRVCI